MIEVAIGVAVGIGIGWVLFERPEWVRNAIDTVKEKIG